MLKIMISTAFVLSAGMAYAQDDQSDDREDAATGLPLATFSDTSITGTEGKEIYDNVCAGCHMPEGEGAFGAGMYPALADNPQLEFASYPIYIIVNGQKGMPALGPIMSDDQIVEVVEYLQTGLNDYESDATVEQVRSARPEDPQQTTGEH
ncbi:c-type cytochrome [Roseivivax isoporae]|uniref:Cytochrome c domain-containing protein n=1 Tax=Roseivivax isoporae LMG 25204 TaxID=1449351 RepID=X7F4S8_9RHOB|nr:cytochrome c [Roseivivax isoporae]ETX27076.1 hypothetical protein RISW2_16845 [Roseivivax isoporae LMG 25204]